MAEDDRRALLTDDEKAILHGEKDVSDSYYYVVVSRVRSKIQKLTNEDLGALEEHDSLADELRDGICGENE
ncbi:hypothetical protein C489_06143 [Natrinema versiforme JCM 10478]|uniref:Uncharacterized protein n=2 Tax=Natrinema versiforme TaxID=88724 RepID=L9Y4B2_9EURY|nr:hypothetical protein C489_06143 [Natrinema versiforme JCM 10478]